MSELPGKLDSEAASTVTVQPVLLFLSILQPKHPVIVVVSSGSNSSSS